MDEGGRRRSLAGDDIPWAMIQLARKAAVVGVPISGHLKIAELRARASLIFGSPSETVRANLTTALKGRLAPSEIEHIARQYHAFSKKLYLWRILPLHPDFHSRRWRIRGIDKLSKAVSSDRGVILVTAHLGYPHIIPAILATQGYEVRQVIAEIDRVEKKRSTETWLEGTTKLRKFIYERTRVLMSPLGPRDLVASLDVRPILAALSNKEMLMIAGDGLRSTQFITLSLFDRPYPFPTGFIRLAQMTKSAVVPVFAVPDDTGGGIMVDIHDPLIIDPERTVEDNLRQFAQVLGAVLSDVPHLWHRWERKNWFDEALQWAEQVGSKDLFRSKKTSKRPENRSLTRSLSRKVRRLFQVEPG